MFGNGSILWIPNYLLPDGTNHPQGKFIIILFSNEAETIVMSVATSRDNVPVSLGGKRFHNDRENGISFYFFPKNLEITDQKFKFDSNTFVYFQKNITKIKIDKLKQQNAQIFSKGILLYSEYRDILYAALKSKFISAKYIPVVESILESLH
jgi:hypothetical protein